MKTYRRSKDREEFPVLWKEGEEEGALPAAELGSHVIGDQEVRGTHVPGPFRIAGEKKPCEEGLVLLSGKGGLTSLPLDLG
jgi:hypothetical protein